MPANFALFLRIGCVALSFFLAMAMRGATPPPHPLMGATREQVLSKLGEPKSQIQTGNRTVLLYGRERFILRDGVVVDVEPIGADPVRRAPSADAAGTAVVTTAPPAGQRSPSTASTPDTSTAAVPTEPQSKVEIKLVRPPSANYVRPSATKADATAPAEPASPTPRASIPSPAPAAADPGKASEPSAAVPANASAPTAPPAPATSSTPASPSEEVAKSEKLRAEAEAREMKAKAIEATRRRLADANVKDPESAPVSSNLLLAGAAVIVGGVGFFIWRWRQRQLELAATTVSNTPVGSSVTAPPIPRKGATFTEEYLAQLDPAHFELMVAAYFNKTGMVATRAKAGQGAVTQIRISWKGEPKPFAGVLCIAHPAGTIEAKALVPMVAELGADDIRRGHVVTDGRFSAGAKQFASEKQLALLPGDALLEKLNALPESVRKEIMAAVAAGGSTPPV